MVDNATYNATGTGSFTWSDSTAWVGGSAPSGSAGASISIEPRTTTATTVNLDVDVTVGVLYSRVTNNDLYFTGTGKLVFDNNGLGAEWSGLHSRTTRFTTLRSGSTVDIEIQDTAGLIIRSGTARADGGTVGYLGGTIRGDGGPLTLSLGMNDSSTSRWFKLGGGAAENTYSGGTLIQHVLREPYGIGHNVQRRVMLDAISTGAFGTGDVTIDGTDVDHNLSPFGSRGMVVRWSADQVMANTATLHIIAGHRVYLDLVGGTTTTIGALTMGGAPQAYGTYTGGDFPWLFGTGTLIVASLTDPYLAVWDTDSVWSEEIAVMRNAAESYAGVYSYTDPGQNDPPNVVSIPDVGTLVPGGTMAQLWDGDASSATSVNMQWRARTEPETTMAGGGLVSDVMDLTGVASPANAAQGEVDPFVLAMSFTWEELEEVWGEGARSPHLVYLDESQEEWIRGGDGNFGGTANYLGLMEYDAMQHGLGDYGYSFHADENLYYAWGVLNHNSQFAVAAVPEPGACLLLGMGLAGWLLAYRRRRR